MKLDLRTLNSLQNAPKYSVMEGEKTGVDEKEKAASLS